MRARLRITLGAVGLGLLALGMFGCRDKPNPPPHETSQAVLQPTWTLALIPEHNVFEQRKQYRPLCAYLESKLGMKVKLKTLSSYGIIWDEFHRGDVDAAFLGSFSYVLAHRQVGVRIVARPEYEDGTTSYRALIITRKDSGIQTLEDLRGKRYAFVHPLTTAGYLFELAQLGLAPSELSSFFGNFFFAGSHDASVLAVFEGRADAGGCKDRVFRRLCRENPALAESMVVIAQSEPVPTNGLAIAGDLPEVQRMRLKRLLLELHHDPQAAEARAALGIRRFLSTNDADYAPVVRMAERVGIDLGSYRGEIP